MSTPGEYVFDQNAINLARRHAGDERVFAQFYDHPSYNKQKSAEEGRPIFDSTTYVRIVIPGNRSGIVERPAREEDVQRFPKQNQAYIDGKSEHIEGTRLDMVPWMSVNLVAELRALQIQTVEQLAGMADGLLSKHMGLRHYHELAKAYLAEAKEGAGLTRLQQELEDRDSRIAALEEQLRMVSSKLEKQE